MLLRKSAKSAGKYKQRTYTEITEKHGDTQRKSILKTKIVTN